MWSKLAFVLSTVLHAYKNSLSNPPASFQYDPKTFYKIPLLSHHYQAFYYYWKKINTFKHSVFSLQLSHIFELLLHEVNAVFLLSRFLLYSFYFQIQTVAFFLESFINFFYFQLDIF